MNDRTPKEMRDEYQEALEMVLDVIAEMRESMDFHNPTLDELEQRIA